MMGMERNKQTFWYALYERSEPTYDEYGNETGRTPVFGNPVMARGNVSASRGAAEDELFGVNAVYTKTINPMPLDCPIDETSVLWIGVSPEPDENGAARNGYNYVVSQVAQSINHKAYAVRRVDVHIAGA